MNSIKDTLDTAATKVTDTASEASAKAEDTMRDTLTRVTKLVKVVRSLGVADMLGAVGLERRRGPGGKIASFGVGVAIGAGLGVLFAPAAGSETRSQLGKVLGFNKLARNLANVESEVEARVIEKKDELKNKAHEASEKISQAAETAKDALKGTNGDVKQKLNLA